MSPTSQRRRARVKDAVELLERQVCNCLTAAGKPARGGKGVKVRCLRCELLELLGADPSVQP